MIALFDKSCNLVGWLDVEKEYIFDEDMNWVAYIENFNVWASNTNNWCGIMNFTNCIDKNGQVVAWNPINTVEGTSIPLIPPLSKIPALPSRAAFQSLPPKPALPSTPILGWSKISFNEWVNQ